VRVESGEASFFSTALQYQTCPELAHLGVVPLELLGRYLSGLGAVVSQWNNVKGNFIRTFRPVSQNRMSVFTAQSKCIAWCIHVKGKT